MRFSRNSYFSDKLNICASKKKKKQKKCTSIRVKMKFNQISNDPLNWTNCKLNNRSKMFKQKETLITNFKLMLNPRKKKSALDIRVLEPENDLRINKTI